MTIVVAASVVMPVVESAASARASYASYANATATATSTTATITAPTSVEAPSPTAWYLPFGQDLQYVDGKSTPEGG